MDYQATDCASNNVSSIMPMLYGRGYAIFNIDLPAAASPLLLNVTASYDKCTGHIQASSSVSPNTPAWNYGDLILNGAFVDLLVDHVCLNLYHLV